MVLNRFKMRFVPIRQSTNESDIPDDLVKGL